MEQWLCFKNALVACLNQGAIVYGGAVRDLMLHNIHAKLFIQEHSNVDYSDVDVSPDTIDRLVIPHDIDCLIGEKESHLLVEYFNRSNFLKIDQVKDVYFNNEKNINYKHIKLNVLYIRTTLIFVKIDMIVQLNTNKLKMPYMNLDFDVNGLILTSYGIGLNEYMNMTGQDDGLNSIENASRLHGILDNIRQKKAFTIHGCAPHRYVKMRNYGWNITFVSKLFRYYFREDYEGDCIICKDKITDCSVNYKGCKCDLRICLGCILKEYTKLDKCPLCKIVCFIPKHAIADLLILKCKFI